MAGKARAPNDRMVNRPTARRVALRERGTDGIEVEGATVGRRRTMGVLCAVALLAAACGGDTNDPEPAGAPTETDPDVDSGDDDASNGDAEGGDDTAEGDQDAPGAAGAADADVVVGTFTTPLGAILVDGDGMSLYLFDDDVDGESTCYDSCAVTWPPLVGSAAAGEGADEALLGSTTRDDGTEQVTYDGMPLYFYAGDQQRGDTAGQGIGGIWWVVGPAGERITETAAPAASTDGY